jgi:hypothetical protein
MLAAAFFVAFTLGISHVETLHACMSMQHCCSALKNAPLQAWQSMHTTRHAVTIEL